jgi:hypothetical protein
VTESILGLFQALEMACADGDAGVLTVAFAGLRVAGVTPNISVSYSRCIFIEQK